MPVVSLSLWLRADGPATQPSATSGLTRSKKNAFFGIDHRGALGIEHDGRGAAVETRRGIGDRGQGTAL